MTQPTRHILLIEDDAIIRMSMASILDDLGWEVSEAASGADAIAQVAAGLRPTAVISDFRLEEGMDGVQAVHQITALLDSPVPGLLLTGDRAAAADAAMDVLLKPVGLNKLRSWLDALDG